MEGPFEMMYFRYILKSDDERRHMRCTPTTVFKDPQTGCLDHLNGIVVKV